MSKPASSIGIFTFNIVLDGDLGAGEQLDIGFPFGGKCSFPTEDFFIKKMLKELITKDTGKFMLNEHSGSLYLTLDKDFATFESNKECTGDVKIPRRYLEPLFEKFRSVYPDYNDDVV